MLGLGNITNTDNILQSTSYNVQNVLLIMISQQMFKVFIKYYQDVCVFSIFVLCSNIFSRFSMDYIAAHHSLSHHSVQRGIRNDDDTDDRPGPGEPIKNCSIFVFLKQPDNSR